MEVIGTHVTVESVRHSPPDVTCLQMRRFAETVTVTRMRRRCIFRRPNATDQRNHSQLITTPGRHEMKINCDPTPRRRDALRGLSVVAISSSVVALASVIAYTSPPVIPTTAPDKKCGLSILFPRACSTAFKSKSIHLIGRGIRLSVSCRSAAKFPSPHILTLLRP